MTKQERRREFKQRRLELSTTEVADKSRIIIERVKLVLTEIKPRSVHCFRPLMELHEVDTRPLFDYLARALPETAVYTSRKVNHTWQIVALSSEPAAIPAKFGCIVVPMLGFDRRLHRLGYGGGYYDRLLSKQPGALKLGVCFELGRVDKLPSEAHDIPLDLIITEGAVYQGYR